MNTKMDTNPKTPSDGGPPPPSEADAKEGAVGGVPPESKVASEGSEGLKEGDGGTTPAPQPQTSPSDPPKGSWPKSAVDRVAKLTARLREVEARGPAAPRPINPDSGKQYTQAELDALSWERAGLLQKQAVFTNQCNEINGRGLEKFQDWRPRLDSLHKVLVDPTDRESQQQYDRFLEACIETGNGEFVIHTLGGNLERAVEVLSLSPVKMAMEVAKIAGEGAEEEDRRVRPSALPKPIKPIGSSAPAAPTKPDDASEGHLLPMSEWMALREKQAKERRIR